jgi:hypothetical protein
VFLAAERRAASLSGANGGQCVEVGGTAGGSVAGIRDSKSPERGHLAVTGEAFAALLASARAGRLDLPLGQGVLRRGCVICHILEHPLIPEGIEWITPRVQ